MRGKYRGTINFCGEEKYHQKLDRKMILWGGILIISLACITTAGSSESPEKCRPVQTFDECASDISGQQTQDDACLLFQARSLSELFGDVDGCVESALDQCGYDDNDDSGDDAWRSYLRQLDDRIRTVKAVLMQTSLNCDRSACFGFANCVAPLWGTSPGGFLNEDHDYCNMTILRAVDRCITSQITDTTCPASLVDVIQVAAGYWYTSCRNDCEDVDSRMSEYADCASDVAVALSRIQAALVRRTSIEQHCRSLNESLECVKDNLGDCYRVHAQAILTFGLQLKPLRVACSLDLSFMTSLPLGDDATLGPEENEVTGVPGFYSVAHHEKAPLTFMISCLLTAIAFFN